jgi:hypothetical protein
VSRPRERALVPAGIGVLAVHVLDDAFFQPEPGRSAGDHLVSGLVPVGLLALAAAAYPLLRAGLRAATALTLGVLGIVAGASEGGYSLAQGGPSGDDWTGLAALAAGVLLVAVGAATLWRTRRLDETPARRYLRRTLVTAAAAVFGFEVVYAVALAYVVTHAARSAVAEASLGRPHEEVSFSTGDGLQLRGWYVPSRNGAAVIAFPGRSGPQPHARMLARHGYGVLLLDRRGEGASEGDPNKLGWGGDRDLKAALSFLRGRADVEPGRIGGLGLSVGGELLLETAAESAALAAVVSEGAGIRSVREAGALSGVAKWLGVPQWAVATAATAVFSNEPPPPDLERLVGRIAPRPVFLIHATRGQGGEELNPTYFAAAGEPRTLWEIHDAKHTGGLTARPEEYERRVVGFFDRALLDSPGG